MKKSNHIGGKNHKKYKKHTASEDKPTLLLKTPFQVYAIVKTKQGGTRISVLCSDDITRSAIIPGKFYKKVWFNQNDLVLCDLNVGGNDQQCYITHKYTAKEATQLKQLGHIQFENVSDFMIQEQHNKKHSQPIRDMFPHSSSESLEECIINHPISEESSESVDIKKL